MNLWQKVTDSIQRWLPSPFTIAVGITLFVIIVATLFTGDDVSKSQYFVDVLGFWKKGFWELLAFTMQMAMILILGHTLALTDVVKRFINIVVKLCNTTGKAAFWVTFFTITVAFLNWGLGLIFGALLARKVGEYAHRNSITINYPLVGTAGYSGLMVWHGGISGSAPITVAGEGHSLEALIGIVPYSQTVFSGFNLVVFTVLLIGLPTAMLLFSKYLAAPSFQLQNIITPHKEQTPIKGVDGSPVIGRVFGLLILATALIYLLDSGKAHWWNSLDLNTINFLLFGLALMLHKSISDFLAAFETGLKGASGILIQFPLYAGIIGVMKYSSLMALIADGFVNISTESTLPIFTFISAGLVNLLVPSGGGQWAVQGPIVMEAAIELNSSIPKNILALAYGDQLTNMLQPFWALPLLGITGLKASDILPYTLLLFLVGALIFTVALVLF